MTTQNNAFFCPRQDTVDFERLPDGMYTAACCGVVLRPFASYDDPSKKEDKLVFLFQVSDNGATYYFKSKPVRPFIGERSSLFVMINTWTGATLERMAQGFSADKMRGYPANLVVVSKTSQKDGKTYQELANILKVPKGTQVQVVPDAIPEYLVRGATNYVLAEGLTVKAPEAAKAPAAPAAAMPFHANPGAPMPNQGLSVTQPATNPQATADPVVPEADDEDLPFN